MTMATGSESMGKMICDGKGAFVAVVIAVMVALGVL